MCVGGSMRKYYLREHLIAKAINVKGMESIVHNVAGLSSDSRHLENVLPQYHLYII